MLALLLQQKKGFYPSGLSFPCLHLEKMLFSLPSAFVIKRKVRLCTTKKKSTKTPAPPLKSLPESVQLCLCPYCLW